MAIDLTPSSKYEQFLVSKINRAKPVGFNPDPGAICKIAFDFQKEIIRWACGCGRAAAFTSTGTGKTLMQLNWASLVAERTGKPTLILAPLAVSAQTIREGRKFGYDVCWVDELALKPTEIRIINYEQIHNLLPAINFGGIVLDESSILKHSDSKTRKLIIDYSQNIHYRLAASATPAPNDWQELGNHAEFLGICTMQEMLARFFKHDGGETSKWTLKGHAKREFWAWVASWAVMVRMPSDLGYEDGDFKLPPLIHHHHVVSGAAAPPNKDGQQFLFEVEAKTLTERRGARRRSLDERVERAIHLACSNDEQWLVWCDLNAESEALAAGIKGTIEIRGSDSTAKKEQAAIDFPEGRIRVLVSKPSIYGAGLNFQNCHNMIFVGLSDSFEQIFQATRRCWRFGQKSPVHVHVITGVGEGAVVENIKRKEKQAEEMSKELIAHVKEFGLVAEVSSRQLLAYGPGASAPIPEWL